MKTSVAAPAPIAIDSVRPVKISFSPSRARGPGPRGRPAARRDGQLCERDQQERRAVREQGDRRTCTGRQGAPDQRTDEKPDRAGRLHEAVRTGEGARPGEQRHERELRRLPDRRAGAEQDGQREHRGDRPGAEREDGHDCRLREGGGDRDRARLQAIDEQPDMPCEQRGGRPERDQQHGDTGPVPARLGAQRERQNRDPVADRRDGDRRCDDAQITRPGQHEVSIDRPCTNIRSGGRMARWLPTS
jgi:hypothetical protein